MLLASGSSVPLLIRTVCPWGQRETSDEVKLVTLLGEFFDEGRDIFRDSKSVLGISPVSAELGLQGYRIW